MNLLVDLGNTRLKWARCAGDHWEPGGSLLHARDLAAQLDRVWSPLEAPSKAVVASVAAHDSLDMLTQWMKTRWSLTPRILVPGRELLGVTNCYPRPETLGADRWAALIAARRLAPGVAAVVDCGTAVTLDALSAQGEYRGGVIFPGLALLRRGLDLGTYAARAGDGDDRSCLARSTADGIAAGTVFGLAGAIDRVLAEFERTLGTPLQVLLTGGDAGKLKMRIRHPLIESPDLVLRGLCFIAEQTP